MHMFNRVRCYATEATLSQGKSAIAAQAKGPFSSVHNYIASLSEDDMLEHVHVPLETLKPSKQDQVSNLLVPLPADIFCHPVHASLLHLLVKQHLASLRAGTASNLSRYDVSASNRKLRNQKGSGRARLGDAGSPMLRGGGRAFAKKPKDWSFHVPKKMVSKGIRGALSVRWANSELSVLENVDMDWQEDKGKTRVAQQVLQNKGWLDGRGTVFYLGQKTFESEEGQLFARATRNLQAVGIANTHADLRVYDLLKPSRIVMDLNAVEEVMRRFEDVLISQPQHYTLDTEQMGHAQQQGQETV